VEIAAATKVAEAWRPWRSYAQMHLWALAATKKRMIRKDRKRP